MTLYEVSAKANGKTYAARFEVGPAVSFDQCVARAIAAMQAVARRFMFGEQRPTEGEELHDFAITQISTT